MRVTNNYGYVYWVINYVKFKLIFILLCLLNIMINGRRKVEEEIDR